MSVVLDDGELLGGKGSTTTEGDSDLEGLDLADVVKEVRFVITGFLSLEWNWISEP